MDLVWRQRHEEHRITEVAIVLWYFVLQNKMVAEGIVGQLGNQPMILMGVSLTMGQDQRRTEFSFDGLEVILDLSTLERKIPVPKPAYVDLPVHNVLKKCLRTGLGLDFADFGGTENHPSYREVRNLGNEPQDGSPATYLNIIGMGSQAKQL